MAATERRVLVHQNPYLEELRKNMLLKSLPPCITLIVPELLSLTRRVHVAFLFDFKYGQCKPWKILMEQLCATPTDGVSRGDWKMFAHYLGFKMSFMQSIENIQPGGEDPVTNTLIAFCYKTNPISAISLIVLALVEMQREDIILMLKEPLSDLALGVLRDYDETSMSNDSGYSSRNSSDELDMGVIFIPEYFPRASCLLKDNPHLPSSIEKIPSAIICGTNRNFISVKTPTSKIDSGTSSPIDDRNIEPIGTVPFVPNITAPQNCILVQSSNDSATSSSPPPTHIMSQTEVDRLGEPVRVVMLTFAADGQEIARELAQSLRRIRANGRRCGVVILNEQQQILNRDPHAFIQGCFRQVDYIVPILTRDYLRSLRPELESEIVTDTDCVDANYTRYIFRMMQDEFARENCMNKRVRTVIPDNIVKPVLKHTSAISIFQAFHRMSAVEKFSEKIFNGRI